MNQGKGKSIPHIHTSRSSISYKSPVAALKISRSVKRGTRRACIIEAWNEVRDLGRAA